MTTITNRTQEANTLITSYDLSKIFFGERKTIVEEMTADADIKPGTVLDRVTATGALSTFNSATGDNNKKPVGILMSSIDNGETANVTILIAGDVASDKLILGGTDTLETVVSGSKVKDLIRKETLGVNPIAVTELSSEDNY
jgi:hypothetical protein